MPRRVQTPRLLLLTPDYPPARGGIQVLAHRLAHGLDRFQTLVLALDSPGARDFDAWEAEIALAPGVGGFAQVAVDAQAGAAQAGATQAGAAQAGEAAWYEQAARNAAAVRGGAQVTVRRVGYARLPVAGRNAALNAAALHEALTFRPQVVLSAHIVTSPAAAVVSRVLGARMAQYFYAKEIADKPRLATFAARRAHAGIAISGYTLALLEQVGVAAATRGAVSLIPPGVDLPPRQAAPRESAPREPAPGESAPGEPAPDEAVPRESAPHKAAQLEDERPTFVTVARLADRYKGHDVLIEALPLVRERVPDVRWVVIGEGPLRPELEACARARGVAEAVSFLGEVSDGERDGWLRRADLLAMPSRLPGPGRAGEGFGIVYLEAGAYGKPVVAGNVAGALDAVVDGETGLLVDPTDPRAVAGAITCLLCDRDLARRLGAAGAARARMLAWPAIAERVQALLLRQLGGRSDGMPERG